eukprot:14318941-Ditylum_brightwellii.AAC.1
MRLIDMVGSSTNEFGDDSHIEENKAYSDMTSGKVIKDKRGGGSESDYEVMTTFKCIVSISCTEDLRNSYQCALTAIFTN